jgi:hypothetical protein
MEGSWAMLKWPERVDGRGSRSEFKKTNERVIYWERKEESLI